MYIHCDKTMEYIRENFSISGFTEKMTIEILRYVNGHSLDDPKGLVLDVLGCYGFEESDLDRLIESGDIICDKE